MRCTLTSYSPCTPCSVDRKLIEEFCSRAHGRLDTIPSNGSDGKWSRATYCNTSAVCMLHVWLTGDTGLLRYLIACSMECLLRRCWIVWPPLMSPPCCPSRQAASSSLPGWVHPAEARLILHGSTLRNPFQPSHFVDKHR